MENATTYAWEMQEQTDQNPLSPTYLLARTEDSRVALLWGESPQADGYVIHRGEEPQNLKVLGTVEENAYLDGYTKPGKTYYYTVCAYNTYGQGPPSDVAAITLPDTPPVKHLHQNQPEYQQTETPQPMPLLAPAGLRAFTQGTRFIALSWQGEAQAGLEYRVYRSETPWRCYGLIAETTDTQYLDTVPEAATKYYYFVQAVQQGRVSQASPMAEALTFPALPPPETPQNLRANPQGSEAIELRWNSARAAAAYVVYARLDPNDDFAIIGHTLDCGWLHEGLPPDSFVDYRVQAYHDSGASELSGVCTGRSGARREGAGGRRQEPNRGQGTAPPMRFPAFSLNAFQRGMN